MSKHIAQSCFYNLPSGSKVHPCRLIQKDGTLMWKHALLYSNEPTIPATAAHEQHIIKTAQRLEELNSWVSVDSETWECLQPVAWYLPDRPELSEGISVYFKHTTLPIADVYATLSLHILPHESLELFDKNIFFKRC